MLRCTGRCSESPLEGGWWCWIVLQFYFGKLSLFLCVHDLAAVKQEKFVKNKKNTLKQRLSFLLFKLHVP